jgi:hypothetical protein
MNADGRAPACLELLRTADLRLSAGVDLPVRIGRAASTDGLLTMITRELLVYVPDARIAGRQAEAGNDIAQVTKRPVAGVGRQLGQEFW